MLRFFLLCSLMHSFSVNVAELDSVTYRHRPLTDISGRVNQIVNGYINDALKIANQKGSCDEKTFLIPLSKRIGTGFVSAIEREIQNDATIDQAFTERKDSIYRNFRFYDAPGMFFSNLASLINVNGYLIGTDKLGHFLGTGFSYYERLHFKGHNIDKVLKFGQRTEKTYYGLMLNGVYSYADLAANLDGLTFWERMIATNSAQNAMSYVRCENNQWSASTPFDIKDYVNPAWDEGVNCSRYRSERLERKVFKQIARVTWVQNGGYQCPEAPQECPKMIERYGAFARIVVTPMCFL